MNKGETEKYVKILIEFEDFLIDYRLIKNIKIKDSQNLEFPTGFSFDILIIYYLGEEECFSFATEKLRAQKYNSLKSKLKGLEVEIIKID
jgi:hypothetical protein